MTKAIEVLDESRARCIQELLDLGLTGEEVEAAENVLKAHDRYVDWGEFEDGGDDIAAHRQWEYIVMYALCRREGITADRAWRWCLIMELQQRFEEHDAAAKFADTMAGFLRTDPAAFRLENEEERDLAGRLLDCFGVTPQTPHPVDVHAFLNTPRNSWVMSEPWPEVR